MQRWPLSLALAAAFCFAPASPAAAEMDVALSGGQLTLSSDDVLGAGEERVQLERSTFDVDHFVVKIRAMDGGIDDADAAAAGCTVSASADGELMTCSNVTNNRVVLHMGPERDLFRFAFDFPASDSATVEVHGGDGPDHLDGGAGTDEIFGDAGDDTVRGFGGPDELDGYVGAGNPAAGTDYNDYLIGGAGPDTMYDSGSSAGDQVDYGFETDRGSGVTVTLDGQANDGHPSYDGQSPSNSMLGGDNVGGGIDDLSGSIVENGGDVLVGNDADNQIYGHDGADHITGNGGQDAMFGQAGDDTLSAADATADTTIDCGIGIDSASTDPNDPAPAGCESVNGSGGGGGPGGGDPGGNGPQQVAVEEFEQKTLAFPRYLRTTKACKGGYCKAAQVKADLEKRGLHVEFRERAASGAALEQALGRKVVPGEVLSQKPAPGAEVKSGPSDTIAVLVGTFDPAKIARCNLRQPFLRVDRKLVRLTEVLAGRTLAAAQKLLKDARCPESSVTFNYTYARGVVEPVVKSARISGSSQKRLEITVLHPKSSLRLKYVKPSGSSGRVPPVWDENRELVLSAGSQGVDLEVQVTTPVDVPVLGTRVELRNAKGEVVDLGIARATGRVFLSARDTKKGRYELWASRCDAESDCLVGWTQIDVVKLNTKRVYHAFDGNAYGYGNKRWKIVPSPSARRLSIRAAAAYDDRSQMGRLAMETFTAVLENPAFRAAFVRDPTNGALRRAFDTLAEAYTAVKDMPVGVMPTFHDELLRRGASFSLYTGTKSAYMRSGVVGSGQLLTSDGTRTFRVPGTAMAVDGGAVAVRVGDVTFLPGGMYSTPDVGAFAAGTLEPLSYNPARLDVAAVDDDPVVGVTGGPSPFLGGSGGTFLAAGVASLIGMDGSSLIGMDGSSLIGMDGSSLIGMDGSSLIGLDGSSLIGMDGSSLRGPDGAPLIGMDGSSLVAAGAGN